jgi:hypothetical protein
MTAIATGGLEMPSKALFPASAKSPAGPRKRPDNNDLPPLVRVADCYTNRSKGRFGLLPFSRRQLEDMIRAGKVRVRRLGPRTTCLTKETVLALQNGDPVGE